VITFEGTVSKGAEVFARGTPAVVVDGRWTMELRLDVGKHDVTFVARDRNGRTATASVTVKYDEIETSDF
jgi:hypothetical protein